MKILFTILLIALTANAQRERADNKFEERAALETPDALQESPSAPLTLIDLSTETITNYWQEIASQKRENTFRIQNQETLGSSYIEFAKLSDDTLRVSVHYLDPNSDSDNYQETFNGTFKWVERFQTMVGTNCWHEPPEVIEIPKVEHECRYGVDIAANVVKVALSANVKDIEEGGYDSLAECVKEKTVRFETTPFHDCFLSTVENTDLARATLAAKVKQMESAGWDCDENNYCKRQQGDVIVSEEVERSSVVVGGDEAEERD